jgi:cytochrome c peroxidase
MLRAFGSTLLFAAAVVAQSNFPAPPAPPNNPPTPQKELLGMALFFEEQLSSTGTVACATCHDFARGGIDPRTSQSINPGLDQVFGTADDQRGSPGISLMGANGVLIPHPTHTFSPNITGRRAPTVINAGYHTHLAYDGGRASLEDLVAVPPLNPVEMGHSGRTWNDVTTKIAAATPLVFASSLPTRLQTFIAGRSYPDLFQLAFGTNQVTQQRIVHAISAYIRTLNSDQSRWDLHLRGQAQLTAQEQQGLNLFTATANGATSCHTCHGDFESRVMQEGPIAGQMTMASSGPYGAPVPTRLVFHNVGIRPIADDLGRGGVTQVQADAGKFRVQSLRNIELMAPYFHNGRFDSLADVLEFYNRGGDFHVNQAANLTPRNYTVVEKDAIAALLRTLTDPRVAAGTQPFDRPTLGSQNGRLVTTFGQGSVTPTGRLVATAPMAPRLGEPWFKLAVHGATPGSLAFLMFDASPATTPMPLNVHLGMTASFSVFPIGAMQWAWTAPTGVKDVPMPLPSNPSLSGAVLFSQWAVLEASNSAILTSNALRIPLL